jgi:hypothetical protein
VLVSLALAALLWQRPTRAVWRITGVIALAFAVFDIAELVHQLDESAAGLAALATAVALAHLATTGIAAAELKTLRTTEAAPHGIPRKKPRSLTWASVVQLELGGEDSNPQ